MKHRTLICFFCLAIILIIGLINFAFPIFSKPYDNGYISVYNKLRFNHENVLDFPNSNSINIAIEDGYWSSNLSIDLPKVSQGKIKLIFQNGYVEVSENIINIIDNDDNISLPVGGYLIISTEGKGERNVFFVYYNAKNGNIVKLKTFFEKKDRWILIKIPLKCSEDFKIHSLGGVDADYNWYNDL